jgi:hypothetical protein
VYGNKNNGITVHGSDNNITIEYNTAYGNGRSGFTSLIDTKINHNISDSNQQEDNVFYSLVQQNNSWQKGSHVNFLSKIPTSSELFYINISKDRFLNSIEANEYKDIGAYSTVFFDLLY